MLYCSNFRPNKKCVLSDNWTKFDNSVVEQANIVTYSNIAYTYYILQVHFMVIA